MVTSRFYNKVFHADLDSMETLIYWIISKINPAAFEEVSQYNIELGLEELIVNIIKHGYKENNGFIYFSLFQTDHLTKCIIRDQSSPFNILNHHKQIMACGSLESMPIGGHGIKIVKAAFKSLNYHYENAMNVLEITLQY